MAPIYLAEPGKPRADSSSDAYVGTGYYVFSQQGVPVGVVPISKGGVSGALGLPAIGSTEPQLNLQKLTLFRTIEQPQQAASQVDWSYPGFMNVSGAGGIDPQIVDDPKLYTPSPTQKILEFSRDKSIMLPDITTITPVAGPTGIIPAVRVKGVEINPLETIAGAVGSVESIWNPKVPSLGGAVVEKFMGGDYNWQFLAQHPSYLLGAGLGEALQFAAPITKGLELAGKGVGGLARYAGAAEKALFLGDQPISRFAPQSVKYWLHNEVYLPAARKLGFYLEPPVSFGAVEPSGSALKYGYRWPYKPWQEYADMVKVSTYAERPAQTTFEPVLQLEAKGGKSTFIGGGVRTVKGELVEVGERRWIPKEDLTQITANVELGSGKAFKGTTVGDEAALRFPGKLDVSTSFAGKPGVGISITSEGKQGRFTSIVEEIAGKTFKSTETQLGSFEKFGEAWEFTRKASTGIDSDFIELPKMEGAKIAGKVKGPMKPLELADEGISNVAEQAVKNADSALGAGKGERVLPVLEEKAAPRYVASRKWYGGFADAAEEMESTVPFFRGADSLGSPAGISRLFRSESVYKAAVGFDAMKGITFGARATFSTASMTGGIGRTREYLKNVIDIRTDTFTHSRLSDVLDTGSGVGVRVERVLNIRSAVVTATRQKAGQSVDRIVATDSKVANWVDKALDRQHIRGGSESEKIPTQRPPRLMKAKRDEEALHRGTKHRRGSYEERINPFNPNFLRDLRKVKL